MIGHLKRFVAAERQESRVPRLFFPFLQHFVKMVERNVVIDSPRILPFLQAEIHVGCQLLVAALQQIALHVREVDVSAIQEIRLVAFFHQLLGNGWQRTAFGRNLHDRKRGKTLVAAEGTHSPSVSPVAVGIAAGKHHSFLRKTVQVRTGPFDAPQRFYHRSAETLHQNDENVGPSGVEQFHPVLSAGGVQPFEEGRPFAFREEVELFGIVLGLAGRGQQAEGRIDRRVVEELVVAEVDLSDVGGRFRHTPSDGDKEEASQQEQSSCPGQPMPYGRQNGRCQPVEKNRRQGRKQQDGQDAARYIERRHTGHGILGRVQVEEHGSIQLESPERIQGIIGHEDQGHDKTRQDIVAHQDFP